MIRKIAERLKGKKRHDSRSSTEETAVSQERAVQEQGWFKASVEQMTSHPQQTFPKKPNIDDFKGGGIGSDWDLSRSYGKFLLHAAVYEKQVEQYYRNNFGDSFFEQSIKPHFTIDEMIPKVHSYDHQYYISSDDFSIFRSWHEKFSNKNLSPSQFPREISSQTDPGLGELLPTILNENNKDKSIRMQRGNLEGNVEDLTKMNPILETSRKEAAQQKERHASDKLTEGQAASAFVTPYNASLAPADNQPSSSKSNRRSTQDGVSSSSKKSAEEIRKM